jgi:hypothetical protein
MYLCLSAKGRTRPLQGLDAYDSTAGIIPKALEDYKTVPSVLWDVLDMACDSIPELLEDARRLSAVSRKPLSSVMRGWLSSLKVLRRGMRMPVSRNPERSFRAW